MLPAGAGRFGPAPGGDRPRGDSTCWTTRRRIDHFVCWACRRTGVLPFAPA